MIRENAFEDAVKEDKPFPFMVIPNFLEANQAEALANALKEQEYTHKQSDLFSFHQTPDLTHSEEPTINAFLEEMRSQNILDKFKQELGVTVTELDAMGVIYADTNYLLCHDDELEDRKIAYILYLSKDFTENSGGALAILDHDEKGRPKDVVTRITPTWNTLAAFVVSDISHHMVEEVLEDKERLTIGGWFHG